MDERDYRAINKDLNNRVKMRFRTIEIKYSTYTFTFSVDKKLKEMSNDGWELICTTSPLGGFSDIIYLHFKKEE